MAQQNNIEALNATLKRILEKNPNAVLFGEDIGGLGGVFRATRGLQAEFGEHRVFDTPIAEAAIAGMALGMAMNGLKPLVEIQFSGFAFPSTQQIFANIARYRNRSRGAFNTGMVIRMPSYGGARALEHHAESLEAMFSHVPGLKVIVPSFPEDVKGLLLKASESHDPVILMESIKLYRYKRFEVPEHDYVIEFGKGRIINEGNKLTLVTYGPSVYDCMAALEELGPEYKDKVEIIDLRSIKPWDQEMIIKSVKKTKHLLVVHEAVKSFSVSSEIITTVSEKCFDDLEKAPIRLTGYDITIPYIQGEPLHIPSTNKIKDRIKKLIG